MSFQRINQLIRMPLSAKDMQKYLGNRANIVTRQQISNMTSIEEVLRGFNHAVIFTAITSPDDGHWQCIFANPQLGQISFFDPYGFGPDYVVQKINDQFGQKPNLTSLLKQYKTVFINPYQYEQEAVDVETCGRYSCAVLLINDWYKNNNLSFNFNIFKQLMDSLKTEMNMSYDQVISYFINAP